MSAYPQMVRDIASLKEEAGALSEHTVEYIAPEKRREFERKVEPFKTLEEQALVEDIDKGLRLTTSLSNQVGEVISIGKTHGGVAFARVNPMWHHLRDRCEVVGRRFGLFNFLDEEDLRPNLWWMVERGGVADLPLLLQLKSQVPLAHSEILSLIDLAVEQISKRSAESIKELCQFFGLNDDEFIGGEDLSYQLASGRLAFDTVRQIENLQTIKQVIEERHENKDYSDFVDRMLRLLSYNYPNAAVNDKVRRVVDQSIKQREDARDSDWDETHMPEAEAASVEAYAIAQIKEYEPDGKFWLGGTYIVLAGIQSSAPEGFESDGIRLPEEEGPLQFDVIVYAEDMEIKPDWKQVFIFNPKDESPPLEFTLTPTKAGEKVVRVAFLYQLHWLATLRFEVSVAPRPL